MKIEMMMPNITAADLKRSSYSTYHSNDAKIWMKFDLIFSFLFRFN
jgi:hypothetical protein